MGLFGSFKSKKEQFRTHIRECFEETVENTIKEEGDLLKDPMFGGLMIQAAIGSMYQTLKNDPRLSVLSVKYDFDPYEIIEEECKRTLNKYLI